MRPKVRAMIGLAAAGGAVTVATAGYAGLHTGVGPATELAPLTVLLALSWAFPLLVLRTAETEAFQLDEAFFVAMALLLPAAGTVLVFALAVTIGNCVRRRPLSRAVFNTGQTVTAAGAGLVAMRLTVPMHSGAPTPLGLAAAVVGAATFMLVNSAAVSLIISFHDEERSAWSAFVDGLDLRVLIWSGSVALGLLAGIGGAAHSWALGLGALPLAALHVVMHEHATAQRQRGRAQGLLVAAADIHASIARGDIERAVHAATMALVGCRRVRLDGDGPREGELGVRLPEDLAPKRWLIATEPVGVEPFQAADREMLEAIAAVAAGALENAGLVEQIRHRAIHDALTDLPNKALFMDRLAVALARAPRVAGRIAVLFMDLDYFKVVNDSLGHDTGDQVLLGVAERLRAAVRPGDTIARIGGDEFAVLCEQVDGEAAAQAIAERLRQAVAQARIVNGVELAVTASVGIVLIDPNGDISSDVLLQAADSAMYRAKERGKDRVEVFDDRLRNRAVARLETETILRHALEAGRLRVFYQPILDLNTEQIVDVEALLRIETASGTLLSPADFIEVAEGSGLIATIGVGVLEEACRQAVVWHDRFGARAPRRIAVNLSARQLSRVPIAETVAQILAGTGCRPDMLALEITETVLMEAGQSVREELATLRRLGVVIGLDDFGTGYSSLAYLKRFPMDFLKVDRGFVAGLGHDPGDEAIVEAVVTLGRSLGLTTVAEGVETTGQMERLRQLGCDRVQGFLFCRPQPASDVEALFSGQRSWSDHGLLVGPASRRSA